MSGDGLCFADNFCYSSHGIQIYLFFSLFTRKVHFKRFFYSALSD